DSNRAGDRPSDLSSRPHPLTKRDEIRPVIKIKKGNGKVSPAALKPVITDQKRPRGRPPTHGMSDHPMYREYHDMRQRCCNPNNKDYPNYGGRGITVCERWLADVNNFF